MIYGRIYCVTNKLNGMQYVGQTTRSLSKRWDDHRNRKGSCRVLYAAILSCGVHNFTIQEIDTADTRENLDLIETEWIDRLQTVAPLGYNLRTGGGSNGTFADESKELCRRIQTGRMNDPDYRERAVAGFKRMFESPEAMRKRAEAINRARLVPENAEREKQGKLAAWARDPERRKRMSEQATARAKDPEFMERWRLACAESTRSEQKKQKNREITNKLLADPAFRAKRLAGLMRPENRARQSALAKKLWTDPAFRAKRAATIAAKKVNKEET